MIRYSNKNHNSIYQICQYIIVLLASENRRKEVKLAHGTDSRENESPWCDSGKANL